MNSTLSPSNGRGIMPGRDNIETKFAGILEARGIKYSVPGRFQLPSGEVYTPDFHVDHEGGFYVEAKRARDVANAHGIRPCLEFAREHRCILVIDAFEKRLGGPIEAFDISTARRVSLDTCHVCGASWFFGVCRTCDRPLDADPFLWSRVGRSMFDVEPQPANTEATTGPNGETVEWVFVDKATAESWLPGFQDWGDGKTNRPINKNLLHNLVRSHRKGGFVVNGDTIVFDSEGRGIDGQHRLSMIVETGIPAWLCVVRGVLPSVATLKDNGRMRTGRDQIKIGYGVKHVQLKATAIRNMLRFMSRQTQSTDSSFIASTYGRLRHIVDPVMDVWAGGKTNVVGHHASMYTGFCLVAKIDSVAAVECVSRFVNSRVDGNNDPISRMMKYYAAREGHTQMEHMVDIGVTFALAAIRGQRIPGRPHTAPTPDRIADAKAEVREAWQDEFPMRRPSKD